MQRSRFSEFSRAALGVALSVIFAGSVMAQTGDGPRLPPGPPVGSGPAAPFGPLATENFLVTSAANQHGSYLWIVAAAQHVIILCEKLDGVKDFTCTSKRMP